jgi:hypothetical protein
MELATRVSCLLLLIVVVSKDSVSAPAASHPVAGTPEALYNIILELENVLFKLKDYARAVQAANSRETQQSGGESKSQPDASEALLDALKSQQSSGASGNVKPHSPPAAASHLDDNSDISLKEALEYLVGLAKQKKLERRDHDIPFPLQDSEREGQ